MTIFQILYYSFIPAVCMLIGGIAASVFQPNNRLTSAIQHFAAGVVFAAVATELLPELNEAGPVVLTVGFMTGVIGMLLLKKLTETLSDAKQSNKTLPWGLLGGVGIDLIIDGILIGIAFLVGTQGGVLIAIALAIEVLFLGLSTSATLREKGVGFKHTIAVTVLLSALIPIGSVGGAGVLIKLPPYYTAGVLAFGVAALLYLVTEELLLEAHALDDTTIVTVSFFVGFLLILLIEKFAT